MKVLRFSLIVLFLDYSSSCQWKQFKLGKLNEDGIKLLKEMGGKFSAACVKLNESIPRMFPEDVYQVSEENQNDEVLSVISESMRYIANIYRNNQTPANWRNDKLELFKNLVSRQVENLEICVGVEMTFSGDGGLPEGGNAKLKSYFEKLNGILKEKGWSTCAWEIVRKEAIYNFEAVEAVLKKQKEIKKQ